MRARLPIITGSIPHPFNRPPGCPFHPRCPEVMQGVCERRVPALRPVGEGQSASCFLYSDAEASS
jgi:peptide/nickel transport system ATP-binding protein